MAVASGPGGGRGDRVARDADVDVAEGPEGAHQLSDADPGDLLEVAGNGEGAEYDREVGLD